MLTFSYEGFEEDNCQDIHIQSEGFREVHTGDSSSGGEAPGAAERRTEEE